MAVKIKFYSIKILFFPFLFLLILGFKNLFPKKTLFVNQQGKGDFITIQAALDFVKSHKSITKIRIEKGKYHEKIYIDSIIQNLSIEGVSRDEVIIQYAQSRDIWRCTHNDDYGAAVLNVKGRDLTLKNLTIINDYGTQIGKDTTLYCPNAFSPSSDNGNATNKTKTIKPDAHQFAFRSFPGSTRIILKNCTFISDGGDTVSPWSVEDGLYYMKDCYIKGHVDAWCPRGTAFAEDCTFYALNSSAFVWHDGSVNKSDKTVMKNCTFDGIKDFPLGRYHKNSKFYFFDCKFSKNMANLPLYYAQKDKTLPVTHSAFYKNCNKEGEQFAWYQDNTTILSQNVNFKWVFQEKW